MAFAEMIKKLKNDGLIDENGKLTQKGHNYVEEVKAKYQAQTKPFKPDDGVVPTAPKKSPIKWGYNRELVFDD